MDTSIHVARIIGPLLIVTSLGVLLGGKSYRLMTQEFLSSRALIYLSGFVTLLIGLETIVAWKPDWPIVLSVVGGLFVVGGALRMLMPERVAKMGMAMLGKSPWLMTASAIVQFLLGLGLLRIGHLL